MKKDRSSLLAFLIALPLIICLLASSASGAKLYTGGERVVFTCKKVKALLQEDKQAKYGIRLLKVLD